MVSAVVVIREILAEIRGRVFRWGAAGKVSGPQRHERCSPSWQCRQGSRSSPARFLRAKALLMEGWQKVGPRRDTAEAARRAHRCGGQLATLLGEFLGLFLGGLLQIVCEIALHKRCPCPCCTTCVSSCASSRLPSRPAAN